MTTTASKGRKAKSAGAAPTTVTMTFREAYREALRDALHRDRPRSSWARTSAGTAAASG